MEQLPQTGMAKIRLFDLLIWVDFLLLSASQAGPFSFGF